MKTIRDIYKNIDLYGNEVFIVALKEKYSGVSYREKSIPSEGSPATKSARIRQDLKVDKVIFHQNNEVTVKFIVPNQNGVTPRTQYARFF